MLFLSLINFLYNDLVIKTLKQDEIIANGYKLLANEYSRNAEQVELWHKRDATDLNFLAQKTQKSDEKILAQINLAELSLSAIDSNYKGVAGFDVHKTAEGLEIEIDSKENPNIEAHAILPIPNSSSNTLKYTHRH